MAIPIRKIISDTLSETPSILTSIVNALPVALFCKDYKNKSGHFVEWNPSAESLWGLKREQAIGKSDYDFFPPEQAKNFQEVDLKTLRDGKLLFIDEEPVDSPTIGRRTVRTWKVPVNCTETGEPRYLLGISLDITILKQLEADLELQRKATVHSTKMASLGEMAGGIAHEINNPLAIIHLRASQVKALLESGKSQPKELLSMVEPILTTAKRIEKIVAGLRSFSRDGSNDLFESVPITDLVNDTLQLCGEKLKNHAVNIRQVGITPDITVSCQAIPISQVLLNLISNAFDAAMMIDNLSDRWIQIEVTQPGEFVQVSVSDSGPGIPKGFLEKIFQPFATTKPIGKGTGLGLSISKGIVEAHGGMLTLNPSAPHTTFSFTLKKGTKNA